MKTIIANNTNRNLESEINSIFRILSATVDDSYVVKKERPRKGAACKGVICLYLRSDLREQEETNRKAKPVASYAFYGSTYNPTRLGSVAVYGRDVMPLYTMIRRNRTFFGHRVVAASIEEGLRPYLDVRFAA